MHIVRNFCLAFFKSQAMGLRSLVVVLLVASGHVSAQQHLSASYSPPLEITRGGTYSGNWESLDPSVPAVLVNTTEAVIIENCTIRSKSDLIKAFLSPAHLTIRNCRGYGLDPGVAGQRRGNFFFGYRVGSLTAEHNYIEATSGGVILWGGNDGWSPDGPLLIRYNLFKNLDGAQSDGRGGRVLIAANYDGGNSAIAVATYQNIPRAEIAWNEIRSEPSLSWTGDTIDINSSSGTRPSPIEIHNNFIHGGYPAVPGSTHYFAGGITMDGRFGTGGFGTSGDTVSTATAFVKIHDNQIVARANFGIGLAAGHDVEVYSNRIVATGQFEDGSWYQGYAGIYIVNCACFNQPASVYFNNFAHDNSVGFRFEWAYPSNPEVFSPPPTRQDYLLTDCEGGAIGPSSKCTNNVSLPDPITSATESNEYFNWQQKLGANGIVVGPSAASGDNFQGLWWHAPAGSESGWGVSIAHQADILFTLWFTYDIDGRDAWFVMSNGRMTATNTYSGTLYRTTGPAFSSIPFDPAQVGVSAAGAAAFTFSDANNGTFAYMVNGISGSKAITRQVFSNPVPTCASNGSAGASPNYQDLWWRSPAASESGWGVNLAHQGDILFATWFTYGPDGRGRWISMSDGRLTGPQTYSGALYRTTGTAYTATAWNQSLVTVSQVGSATFSFADANNGTFVYTLDGVSQSKPITRQVYALPSTVCH